jgi:hypothetical protein
MAKLILSTLVSWHITGPDNMKKFLLTMLLLLIPTFADAQMDAALLIQHVPPTIAQQEQFYVDVAIDPQGNNFNGVEGSITFSSNTLQFVRAETGSSIISTFIDTPTLVSAGTVRFSGIIIGGFDGLINPFDQSHKLPGQIVRLVFVGKKPGNVTIASSNVSIAANDGKGTIENLSDTSAASTVSDQVAPSVYNLADTIAPTLTASVVSNKNLYNGQYTVIFTATDKQSGIDHVELKEGSGPWVTVQSPYLLHDQSRRAILSLRAYDVAGNDTTITIPSAANTNSSAAAIMLVLVVALIVYAIYEKTSQRAHKNIS